MKQLEEEKKNKEENLVHLGTRFLNVNMTLSCSKKLLKEKTRFVTCKERGGQLTFSPFYVFALRA